VPQTSLAAELREEAPPAEEEDVLSDDFTAERAASSLAGFQRGTLQARDDDAREQYDHGEAVAPDAPRATPSSTPLADRS
jgi:hypothetical protein